MSEHAQDQEGSPQAQETPPLLQQPAAAFLGPADPYDTWIADAAPGISLTIVSAGLYIAMTKKWVSGDNIDGAAYLALPFFLLFWAVMRSRTEFIHEKYAESRTAAIHTILVAPVVIFLVQLGLVFLVFFLGGVFMHSYPGYAALTLGASAAGIAIYWGLALGYLQLRGPAGPTTRRWQIPRHAFLGVGLVAAFVLATQTGSVIPACSSRTGPRCDLSCAEGLRQTNRGGLVACVDSNGERQGEALYFEETHGDGHPWSVSRCMFVGGRLQQGQGRACEDALRGR